jgi:hypothetical protein
MYSASFQGVKWSGRGSDSPSPSSAELVNGLEIYLRLLSVPASAFNGGDLYLYWTCTLDVRL